ncbi:MAG: aminomethyl transferase family protein [Chloroflexi bacterium]|nr:aminomethyl transferase family protein [Chloroflexota bacterium]
MTSRTPLYDIQRGAGATFTHLAGWEIADTFGSPADEYRAATEGAAVLDRSYMGRFDVTGKDAPDLLNRLSSNRVDPLPPGTGAATILTTNKGRVIDLLHLFSVDDRLVMLTSPETRERVAEYIDMYTFLEEAALEDITEATSMITVLGPSATDVVRRVTGLAVVSLTPYGSLSVNLGDATAMVLRTDPAGNHGYDFVVAADQAEAVWSALVDAGASPIGERTYNALRVEAGVPRYGWELSEAVNPWEVNLAQYINFEKGCYIGQEVILRLNTYQKVQRRMARLSFSEAAAAEGAGMRVEGKDAGIVTSWIDHPQSGEAIGLGLVRSTYATAGAELEVVNEAGEQVAVATVREVLDRAPVLS